MSFSLPGPHDPAKAAEEEEFGSTGSAGGQSPPLKPHRPSCSAFEAAAKPSSAAAAWSRLAEAEGKAPAF